MKIYSFMWFIAVALQLSLLWLQPAVAQVTAPPTPPGEPVYKVLSPLGESTAKTTAMAPRLDTLDGKTVCLVWNYALKADITLPAIAEEMKKRYPGINNITYTVMTLVPLPM